MTARFLITVNEGGPFATSDENAIYFTGGWEILTVEVGNERPVKMIGFTPNNGRRAGKPHFVPYERLVSIAEDD